MNIRKIHLDIRKEKPGRYLTAFDLAVVAQILGAPVAWCYVNTMEPAVVSGNHWHRHKSELFVCVRGVVGVYLANPETGERSETELFAGDMMSGLVVPAGIAHAVKNRGDSFADLLVFATGEPRGDDDVEFFIF